MEQGVVQVGRYRLIAELGHGGMAEVFLAVARGPPASTSSWSSSCSRPDLADDEQFLAMFLDEARLAARLNHPNVVQTYEVGSDGGRYFIAMEYLEGQPLHRLRQRVAAGARLPARRRTSASSPRRSRASTTRTSSPTTTARRSASSTAT